MMKITRKKMSNNRLREIKGHKDQHKGVDTEPELKEEEVKRIEVIEDSRGLEVMKMPVKEKIGDHKNTIMLNKIEKRL